MFAAIFDKPVAIIECVGIGLLTGLVWCILRACFSAGARAADAKSQW